MKRLFGELLRWTFMICLVLPYTLVVSAEWMKDNGKKAD